MHGVHHRCTNLAAQRVVAVGPRADQGGSMVVRACVGLAAECDLGPYGTPQRRAAEQGMLLSLDVWARGEGARRPTSVASGGWTLSCTWTGKPGTRHAALTISPVGGPSSEAMAQLRRWMEEGSIRLPLASDPSVVVLVPCMACPGELPWGQVQVTFVGLPSAWMLKDTPAAILGAVGYTGRSTADAPKLRVTEVFLGWHAEAPDLADGSLCAFVDQPVDDPELRKLPSSICLGHDRAVIEVRVSSRRATFVSTQPAAAAPAAQPAEAPHTQPPPPPPRTAWGGTAAGQQVPRTATAAAAAAAAAPPVAAAATPPTTVLDEHMDVEPAAAAAPTQGEPPRGDALDLACADRPAIARQLAEWANNSYGHNEGGPARVRQVLARAVEESDVVRGILSRLVEEEGDLNLSERPPENLQLQLVEAFGRAGFGASSYDAADGRDRRSSRLRGRSRAPSARRGATSRVASEDGGGVSRESRSRSRSRSVEVASE